MFFFPICFYWLQCGEGLGLKAHWKLVARLPLNIRLAGLTAGPPPSLREKKMIQCHSVDTHTEEVGSHLSAAWSFLNL